MAKIIENYSELTNDYKVMDRKVTMLTCFVVINYVFCWLGITDFYKSSQPNVFFSNVLLHNVYTLCY